MLFFDHANRDKFVPRSLSEGSARELKFDIQSYLERDSLESAQTDVPNVWKSPLEPDVVNGLLRLSASRCAFCERRVSNLFPYRFRPPAHALSNGGATSKPSYLWLAFSWDNFFPICKDCTPSTKNYFPVTGDRAPVPEFGSSFDPFLGPGLDLEEEHVLYYPGEKGVTQAFKIRLDGYLSGNRRADTTIAHFGLNRADLAKERALFLRHVISELTSGPPSNLTYETLSTEARFPGAAYLLARRIGNQIRRFQKRQMNLAPAAIASSFARLWRDKNPTMLIEAALDEMQREDEGRAVSASGKSIGVRLPTPDVNLHQPRIKRVRIRNFKSLEAIDFSMKAHLPEMSIATSVPNEFSDGADAPCLLILGENAAGKSSILEAVALACLPKALRDQLDENAADLLLDPEYMGSAGRASLDNGSVEIEFHDAPALTLNLDRLEGFVPGSSQAEHPLIFAYGAHRLFDKARRDDPIRHVDTLFKRDRQISNPEPWLIELSRRSPESLDEVVSALRHIIQIDGQFRNIQVERDANGKEYCAINIQRTNPDGRLKQRLNVVSSGYRAVLAVVCDVFSRLLELANYDPRAARHAHAIILIDEIEAHLHPRWKMQIISGLRRALPRSTFILTSHDPLCLRGMFAGEVMMLNRFRNTDPSGGRLYEEVEQISEFSNIENLTVDQLLTSDIFQLFTTDDRRIETAFAEVPALLKKEEVFIHSRSEEWRLSEREQSILRAFRREISDGLPYGKTEVSRLVQEAVAEYVASRRQKDKATNDAARENAKAAVKAFLGELLG